VWDVPFLATHHDAVHASNNQGSLTANILTHTPNPATSHPYMGIPPLPSPPLPPTPPPPPPLPHPHTHTQRSPRASVG
jgi:hypothetical protein